MTLHVLLSDDVHLHAKNFASLFEFLNGTAAVSYSLLHQGRSLWNRYGEYAGVAEVEDIAERLRPLDEGRLRGVAGGIGSASVNAFEIARAEILSFVTCREKDWYSTSIPNDDDFIFSKLYSQNNHLLRLNLAAVLRWCDIYRNEIRHHPPPKTCIIFSGSQIYQRLLLEYCKSSSARAIVVESFQTGSEFYCEERYTPIARGSDIRYSTVFNSLALPTDAPSAQNERNRALNKLLNGQNKNVTQPDDAVLPEFNSCAPCVLICAQVQNDFSILESNLEDLNALSNYRRLIDEFISKTKFNVIIKAHPWERRKTHLGRPFIYEELTSFVGKKSLKERCRIHVCEDENLKSLIDKCDAFVTLTSQSAIEACLYGGLRPFTLGLPFYSAKGFTNDFRNVEHLVASLREDGAKWRLTLPEYEMFVDFIARLLQVQLASVQSPGTCVIRDRIIGQKLVEVGTIPKSKTNKQSNGMTPSASMVHPSPAPASSSDNLLDDATEKAAADVVPTRRRLIRPIVAKIGNEKDVRKFDKNPSRFFADLRNPWYRRFGAILFPPERS